MKCVFCRTSDHWGVDCTKIQLYEPCIYCGSERHLPTKCSIKLKAGLLVAGTPPEDVFDYVIELETIEELPRGLEIIREDNKEV